MERGDILCSSQPQMIPKRCWSDESRCSGSRAYDIHDDDIILMVTTRSSQSWGIHITFCSRLMSLSFSYPGWRWQATLESVWRLWFESPRIRRWSWRGWGSTEAKMSVEVKGVCTLRICLAVSVRQPRGGVHCEGPAFGPLSTPSRSSTSEMYERWTYRCNQVAEVKTEGFKRAHHEAISRVRESWQAVINLRLTTREVEQVENIDGSARLTAIWWWSYLGYVTLF